jgi:CBS domain-containing protein
VGWTARDLMQTGLRTVTPDTPLVELVRRFLEDRVGGYPVAADGRLLGIVSRSDVVRQLSVEQSVAEQVSDFYRDVGAEGSRGLEAIASQVGSRLEELRVEDAMVHSIVSVEAGESLAEVARRLLERGIHRILVVEGERPVGLITSLDFVRLFAEARVGPRPEASSP